MENKASDKSFIGYIKEYGLSPHGIQVFRNQIPSKFDNTMLSLRATTFETEELSPEVISKIYGVEGTDDPYDSMSCKGNLW